MSTNRDDFDSKVTDTLAKRAGYLCSNPTCRTRTILPSTADPAKYIYTGVAAHITAAASNGPRYDATLSPDQRSSIENGIHLCGTCSVMIDKNKGLDFSTATLKQWKTDHESWVIRESQKNPTAFAVDLIERAIFSYARDFAALRRHTEQTLESLSEFTSIEASDGTITITRECLDALVSGADTGPLLVVGEPGAGKSGILHEVALALQRNGADTLVFSAERLTALSPGELRDELNLTHELEDILTNWPGNKPGVLIIDALDAARAERAARTLRELIERVRKATGLSRWHVVASIRKFDLRHSPQVRRLFPGAPVDDRYADPEFQVIRHLNVLRLSDSEMGQMAAQSPDLAALVAGAGIELREVLRNPFNLRLAGELLRDGVPIAALTPLRTQVELLERYWEERVIRNDGGGDARELILDRAAEKMIAERSLRVERRAVLAGDPAASGPLDEVLRAHVLVEWQRSAEARPEAAIVAFSHHVLFDFASSRLFRGLPITLVRRIESDPNLVVFLRPSLELHFQYLWEQDPERASFWESALALAESDVTPEIGKLVAPSVAARLIRTPRDWATLLKEGESDRHADGTYRIVHHIRGALLALDRPLVGSEMAPWASFVEEATRSGNISIIRTLCSLLMNLGDSASSLLPAELTAAGIAARRFLEVAWNETPVNSWLAGYAIEAVCKTVESDPAAAVGLLQHSLREEHLAEHGFEEMPCLSGNIRALISATPELAQDIYTTVFGFQETSEERTPAGLMTVPMSSTRRQDYELARYDLTEKFPQFLEKAPEHAVRALLRVLENYVESEHALFMGRAVEEPFDLGGVASGLRADASATWSGLEYRFPGKPINMLDVFAEYLQRISGSDGPAELRCKLVALIATENRLGLVWSKVLEVGASAPDTLGNDLRSALWAVPLLVGVDTRRSARQLLRAAYARLPEEDRERVERTILNLPDPLPEAARDMALRERDRLLACLDVGSTVLEETREALAALVAQDGAPPEELPAAIIPEPEWGEFTEAMLLQELGVDLDSPENAALHALVAPVEAFYDANRNSAPTTDSVNAVIPHVEALFEVLTNSSSDGAHPAQDTFAWGRLAGACEVIVRDKTLDCRDAVGACIRTVLLAASVHPDPALNAEDEDQFASHAMWGSPATRVDAAKGLILLATRKDCSDAEVLKTIENLSQDTVPAVRFQIAARLNVLFDVAPEWMWDLAERFVREENNPSVVEASINALWRVSRVDSERVATLVSELYDRLPSGDLWEKVRVIGAQVLASLHVWRGEPATDSVLRRFVNEPVGYATELGAIAGYLRQAALNHGGLGVDATPKDNAIRQRAVVLIGDNVHNVVKELEAITARNTNARFAEWSETDRSNATTLARLGNKVGTEVYYASGTFDQKRPQSNEAAVPEPQALVEARRQRFFDELYPTLELLVTLGEPRLSYQFLEMLDLYAAVDPARVFNLAHSLVKSGAEKSGFQFDSLAARSASQFVARYLAEHQELLRVPEYQERLVTMLDTFVQAGWPSAVQLVYRLDELSR